jgi:YD repeat-containing protein
MQRVSAVEAKRLIDDEGYQFIDVRSAPEYDAGHPSGAHNVPLFNAGATGLERNEDFLRVMEALYPKQTKLLVGCAVGQRSQSAVRLLTAAGWSAVIDLRPGTKGAKNAFGQVTEKGWDALGLPVELTTKDGSWRQRQAMSEAKRQ